MSDGADFYATLPVFSGFASVTDPMVYEPLPDDWLIGLSDVVESTKAIEAGRYKVVNTAGAALIAAVTNARGRREFPYVFGGDGASFAVPGVDETLARTALAATAAWARDELDLGLRVALIPLATIRTEGFDVRVARFAPSKNVSYAMFSGGGISWAERALKAGRFAVAPAEPGARPDLNGLSCRFEEMPASRGVILSLLVAPGPRADEPSFRTLLEDFLATLNDPDEAGRPIPDRGPALSWRFGGLDLEVRALRKAGQSLALKRASVLARALAALFVFRSGMRVGRFDPGVYRQELVENSDFRKYDDGLRMTLDCTPDLADRIERRLQAAEAAGIARFGLHRQTAAIMTCFTPSVYDSQHVHFIDGAAGGYASAAQRLKG